MSIVENKSVRPKLGRGLAALLGEDGSDHVTEGSATNKATRSLPVASLQPGGGQPRRHFNEEALDALAQSIRERGMLQPIIARGCLVRCLVMKLLLVNDAGALLKGRVWQRFQ
jgi:ParB family chromosome partitioning protein